MDYGHLDMLDDYTLGVTWKITYCLCKNGESRKPIRTFVGAVMVAFLKAYSYGDNVDLLAIREGKVRVTVPI